MRELKLNIERALLKQDKKKRAAELVIANRELAFQTVEKGKRAAELVVANKELVFQNAEKEKRAAELTVANTRLIFENNEKEKRASELVIANKELAFQNNEKENRAAELVTAHKDLESFTFISSHHLQEPLRKIQMFSSILLSEESKNLSVSGKRYFEKIQAEAWHLQALHRDLLVYTSINATEKFERKDLAQILEEVKIELEEELHQKNVTIETNGLCEVNVIPSQFRQLLKNLIGNAIKFSKPRQPSHIVIKSVVIKRGTPVFDNSLAEKNYCHISVTDNGIGFRKQHKDLIFEMYQRINKDKYVGTGMGLTIAKKIVEIHGGVISATGELNKGASFEIYLPLAKDLKN
ncbi:ATP-binding protein [Segetibacter sp.]|uniref:sensor histidine kinase n=1 Tax=Segetibacter sp. TaxID=2231182 RepID=UPI0026190962|nr:ATP-binding protein [Segetibacter sp.]MCW3080545.1 two-component sensor histidine kinase [Segetibacter sp.]